jgi:hypothetical protein
MPAKLIVALSDLVFRIGFEDEAVGAKDPNNEIKHRDHFVSTASIEARIYSL